MLTDDWGYALFPMVPGHEIVGRVSQVGANVSKFVPGEMAAVGCMVDSCRSCEYCEDDLEQYCTHFATMSFSSRTRDTGEINQGGFSSHYVVDERFALKVPEALDPAGAAPLLCGGITTYSPLRHWGVGEGTRLGVVGLGGLGHLATKFGRALGAHVTVLTRSPDKAADAVALGADAAVVTTDAAEMARLKDGFDFILDTVSGDHDVQALVDLLRVDGTLCMVGVPMAPMSIPAPMLEMKRRSVAGSLMGGIAETQEMLDFCGERGIAADVEVLPVSRVNEAFARLARNDVRYRFVLDMAELHATP
jgi:uncharacterized zinc-type alcohol dehydrogenase-like protein